ncbi:MAG: EAL domain-containing protein [Betaproteobacteria bacterium]
MTLERRLVAGISALVLAVLIGVQYIHLRNAQRALQNQLESVSQDAATAIGLSLGVLMRDGDRVVAQTTLNAAFDRGHYERIELRGLGGELLASRALETQPPGRYPSWLAGLFPLYGPTTESLVSSGWRQLGKLRVTVYPRFAYEQLWATTRDTALYLLAIYAVALLLLRLFMRGVLRPLYAIERAAASIARRDYVEIEERPATRELSNVVLAMNAMSRKVGEAIAGEAARAESLQRAAHSDDVSGLLNRRGLVATFDTAYAQDREAFSGVFALLDIGDLAGIDEALGRSRCDELLRAAGHALGVAAGAVPGGLAARWSGAVFALALPGTDRGAALEALARLKAELELLIGEYGQPGRAAVAAGGVECSAAHAGAEALAEVALEALARAGQDAGGGVMLRPLPEGEDGPAASALVRDALRERRLRLFGQTVFSLPGATPMQVEVMARIAGAHGTLLAAAEIMPVVSREGLSRQMDELVVESVLRELSGARAPHIVSINLSARSLAQGDFLRWLAAALAQAPESAARLVFELSEHGVAHDEAAAASLAAVLQQSGAALAIDHFGMRRDSLALAQRLRPAYLKLSGMLTPALRTDPGTRFFVDSLLRAARQLDIPVIAQNVEDAAALADLAALGFAGYQGYAASAPAAWPLYSKL